MKVIIREPDHPIDLRLPTGLLLNRCTAGIICREAEKYGVRISRSQMKVLIKALNTYRRSHPDWVLVEVSGADGEYVQVKL